MEDFTDQDLINELLELDPILAERKPGGITTQEYSALYHIDQRTAQTRLTRYVDDGILRRELCRIPDKAPCFVYYSVQNSVQKSKG